MQLDALRARSIPPASSASQQPYPGAHAHFWDRAMSRRAFLASSGAMVGILAGADVLRPVTALASSSSRLPKPIPNGILIPGPNGPELFHLFLPGPSDNLSGSLESPGGEESTIYDFNGALGVAAIKGQGTGTSTTGKGTLFYDVDCRFMSGRYVDRGGKHRRAAFGFV